MNRTVRILTRVSLLRSYPPVIPRFFTTQNNLKERKIETWSNGELCDYLQSQWAAPQDLLEAFRIQHIDGQVISSLPSANLYAQIENEQNTSAVRLDSEQVNNLLQETLMLSARYTMGRVSMKK